MVAVAVGEMVAGEEEAAVAASGADLTGVDGAIDHRRAPGGGLDRPGSRPGPHNHQGKAGFVEGRHYRAASPSDSEQAEVPEQAPLHPVNWLPSAGSPTA